MLTAPRAVNCNLVGRRAARIAIARWPTPPKRPGGTTGARRLRDEGGSRAAGGSETSTAIRCYVAAAGRRSRCAFRVRGCRRIRRCRVPAPGRGPRLSGERHLLSGSASAGIRPGDSEDRRSPRLVTCAATAHAAHQPSSQTERYKTAIRNTPPPPGGVTFPRPPMMPVPPRASARPRLRAPARRYDPGTRARRK
jgi:hypothetical protein